MLISIGDKLSTKIGQVGVKEIKFFSCPISSPANYINLDKVELSAELDNFIEVITHKGVKIKFNQIHNLIKEPVKTLKQ